MANVARTCLTAEEQRALRQMAERLTVERAAKALEVSQGSFGKAAAGLPLTKATALFVRAGLARIKEAGEAGGAS